MNIFQRWGLVAVLPVFIGACVFFGLFIELIDLFSDLPRYLVMKQSIPSILFIQVLYLPKCLSFGFPIAMVFAISLTLGNFYANNELIAVFSSGVSLFRFCLPLLAFALLVSIGSFFFQEHLVIDTFKQKNELRNKALGFADIETNPNVVLFDHGTRVVYKAVLYNDKQKSLNDTMVVCRNSDGFVTEIVKAPSAHWDDTAKNWVFNTATIYKFKLSTSSSTVSSKSSSPEYTKMMVDSYRNPELNIEPTSFKRITQSVDELRFASALAWVESLQKSGLPFRAALTKLYERFSFACTPFMVAFIACSIGSRFRKNILLLSLLVSLMLAVIYYVIQMVAGLLATFQILSPQVGAWIGVVLYFVVGTVSFRRART